MTNSSERPPTEPTIRDHRTPPRGVLSQNAKTLLLLGGAAVILVVIVTSGNPTPPTRSTQPAQASLIPNSQRVQEYEQRLVELGARGQAVPPPAPVLPPKPLAGPEQAGGRSQPPDQDPETEERRRKEYESLFAANLVLSRRAGAKPPVPAAIPSATAREDAFTVPSIDEVAQAVVRATAAAAGTAAPPAPAQPADLATAAQPRQTSDQATRPDTHRVFEGTLIDAVLANRLDGSMAGPVNALVTNSVYAQDLTLVIPAGARVLGNSKPVQSFGDTRLAVAFHRLVLPNGRDVSLNQFVGLNQRGDGGLADQANRHYLATFGAAAAVGLISGFAQWVSGGFSRTNGGTIVIAGSVGDATSQATAQTMSRFLNRLPTITIREGHRVKVYLTGDLNLPAYGDSQ